MIEAQRVAISRCLKLKLEDLRVSCRLFEIDATGNKPDVLARLKEYFGAAQWEAVEQAEKLATVKRAVSSPTNSPPRKDHRTSEIVSMVDDSLPTQVTAATSSNAPARALQIPPPLESTAKPPESVSVSLSILDNINKSLRI